MTDELNLNDNIPTKKKCFPDDSLRNHGQTTQAAGGRVVGGGDGLGMLQAHYIRCVLYFYYYYINSTSDHQALDPRG